MDQNYNGIAGQLEKLKGLLRNYVLIGGVVNIAVLIGLWTSFSNRDSAQKFSTIEACYYGIESLKNNDFTGELLGKSIVEDLEKSKTIFKIEKIHLIKRVTDFSCDVVIKDNKGYQSFLMVLDKSIHYTHGIKVSEIKGQKIISRYQR